MGGAEILVADSVTTLGAAASGAVLVAASHGGAYSGYLAARAGARAVVLNDAGIGRERAGVGALGLLQAIGRPAATYSHQSARIGMGSDAPGGVLSVVNDAAAALGLAAGMGVGVAARLLLAAPGPGVPPPPAEEARALVCPAGPEGPRVLAIDSASLVEAADHDAILACGSHGGLMGGRAATALKHDALAVLFNDADGGLEMAAITRLPALQARGIPAGTVSAWSARIGDGRSTLQDGFVTHQNARAAALGGLIGMSARAWVGLMRAAAREGRLPPPR